jgi:tetratricopeptide (TPR) repeat protein
MFFSDNFPGALSVLDQALAADDRFAAAHALRSLTLFAIGLLQARTLRDRVQAFSGALEAARRAVTMAPGFAIGHIALGDALRGELDIAGGLSEMKKALELEPGSAFVQTEYGSYENDMGRFDLSLPAIRTGIALDPRNYLYRVRLVAALTFARQPEEALRAAEDAKALSPEGTLLNALIWNAYFQRRDYDRARTYCESRAVALEEDERHHCLADTYHALGRIADAAEELAHFESIDGDIAAYQYACVYAQWGDYQRSMEWLRRALAARDPYLIYIKVDWELNPMRGRQAFEAFIKQLQFPP